MHSAAGRVMDATDKEFKAKAYSVLTQLLNEQQYEFGKDPVHMLRETADALFFGDKDGPELCRLSHQMLVSMLDAGKITRDLADTTSRAIQRLQNQKALKPGPAKHEYSGWNRVI